SVSVLCYHYRATVSAPIPLHVPLRSFLAVIFFFSSRRRHTRCYRDWSSDVCSSDFHADFDRRTGYSCRVATRDEHAAVPQQRRQIGRASCRERAEISVGAGTGNESKSAAVASRVQWYTE